MRIGQTFFKNTDFIYYAIQRGIIKLDEALQGSTLHTAHPPELGERLLKGGIDIAPASSIIYAQHPNDFLLLPDFSISAFGETGSILIFSEKCDSLEKSCCSWHERKLLCTASYLAEAQECGRYDCLSKKT